MSRPFTGWHMAGILTAFFGVVIAVNVYMATEASRTFGGTIVENSYVASQRFNRWLSEAHAQAASGVTAFASTQAAGQLVVTMRAPQGPRDGAIVQVEAEHPLGRVPGRTLELSGVGNGRYVATHSLPQGRWRLRITARSDRREFHFDQDIRL